jgi:hypothetical protein
MPAKLKFTPDKKFDLLKLLKTGNSLTAASSAVGVTLATVENHRRKYPKFDRYVRSAMAAQIQVVADSLFHSACQGNVTAQIFFLCNRTVHVRRITFLTGCVGWWFAPPSGRCHLPSAARTGRHPDPATRERWQQRLRRYRTSGLTVPAFCDREGVSTASF